MSQTSFEDRLARIQNKRPDGAADTGAFQQAPVPQTDKLLPKAPLADSPIKSFLVGLFAAFNALGTVVKIGIAGLLALTYLITPDVGTKMAVMSVDEFGQVKSADASGEDRYEWDTKETPFNAARLGAKRMNAFAQDEADWAMADLIKRAEKLDQPFLAKEIARKMGACDTLICRSKLKTQYEAKLERLTKARPRL